MLVGLKGHPLCLFHPHWEAQVPELPATACTAQAIYVCVLWRM